MRSIERRFYGIQKRNPRWSSYICFAQTIGGKKYTPRAIGYWFKKLVEKNDYLVSEKKAIIRFLRKL